MKVENDSGFIEFRKPNMLEGLEFLGRMGLNSENCKDEKHLMENDLYYTAQAIKHMEPFIDKVSIKLGKKKIDSFQKAIDEIECMGLLTEASAEIMNFIKVSEKKRD